MNQPRNKNKVQPSKAAETPQTEVKPAVEGKPQVVVNAKSEKVPALRISAKVAGFRRSGRAWPVEAVDVATSEFTEQEIEQLKGESGLVVVDTEIDAPVDAE